MTERPEQYAAGREFVDAGFEEVCVVQGGTDREGPSGFFMSDIRPQAGIAARKTA
jgi:hypothetical protein